MIPHHIEASLRFHRAHNDSLCIQRAQLSFRADWPRPAWPSPS
jgi:hypothetical protein